MASGRDLGHSDRSEVQHLDWDIRLGPCCVVGSLARSAASRGARAEAPASGAGTLAPSTRTPDRRRPPALGLALARLDWMADDARPGAAGTVVEWHVAVSAGSGPGDAALLPVDSRRWRRGAAVRCDARWPATGPGVKADRSWDRVWQEFADITGRRTARDETRPRSRGAACRGGRPRGVRRRPASP